MTNMLLEEAAEVKETYGVTVVTALHWAAQRGSPGNIEALVDAETRIDSTCFNFAWTSAQNFRGSAPLHWAANSATSGIWRRCYTKGLTSTPSTVMVWFPFTYGVEEFDEGSLSRDRSRQPSYCCVEARTRPSPTRTAAPQGRPHAQRLDRNQRG